MKTRLDPLKMALAATKSSPSKEVARASNTQLGECPICIEEGMPSKMRILKANGVDCYTCTTHRICLPTRNV